MIDVEIQTANLGFQMRHARRKYLCITDRQPEIVDKTGNTYVSET